ncbi:MAG: flippase-like domain-containing protein [Rhodospirillales bacterium]|nr:flippase-like domain-containing protein [Rhodospirillales bacterium]
MYRLAKFLYFGLGAALLVWVFAQTDLTQVVQTALGIGVLGFLVVLALYLAAFGIDVLTFQLALPELPVTRTWFSRVFLVRLVGELFNTVLPAGGMGGEPLKAMLMNRHYGIGWREGAASLVIGKTVNMIALVLFLTVGFAFILAERHRLPEPYTALGGAGLLAFAFSILAFVLIQRLPATSTLLGRFGRLAGLIAKLRDFEDRLAEFYIAHKKRLVLTITLAFANWILGIAELWAISRFLGHSLTLTDAWIIEAALQLVRTGAFFIPTAIGVQEGAFLLLYAALAGSADLGVAVALVRRARELVWLGWGALAGLAYARVRP